MLVLKIELVNYWEGSNTVNIQGVNTARKQKSKYNNNNNNNNNNKINNNNNNNNNNNK